MGSGCPAKVQPGGSADGLGVSARQRGSGVAGATGRLALLFSELGKAVESGGWEKSVCFQTITAVGRGSRWMRSGVQTSLGSHRDRHGV